MRAYLCHTLQSCSSPFSHSNILFFLLNKHMYRCQSKKIRHNHVLIDTTANEGKTLVQGAINIITVVEKTMALALVIHFLGFSTMPICSKASTFQRFSHELFLDLHLLNFLISVFPPFFTLNIYIYF